MSNQFSKEDKIRFDLVCEGFTEALVMPGLVDVVNIPPEEAQRSGDTVLLPQPYILPSYDGTDATANFKDITQLTVPVKISKDKYVPWVLTDTQLRDSFHMNNLVRSAKQRLASDVNYALVDAAAKYGSLFVKRTVAATGYTDISLAETIMTECGVPQGDRIYLVNTGDNGLMAGNLAGRQTVAGRVETAMAKSIIGEHAGFSVHKNDIPYTLGAAAGGAGITMDTRDAAGNYYVPAATSVSVTGEESNVDNRFQTITVSSTANVAAGDAFTVAALDAVHHITKTDTTKLKTFRVVSVPDGTHLVITPPMVTGQGGSMAEVQYQNCVINTKAANSALVFLNTTAAQINAFWHKSALVIVPGTAAPDNSAGMGVMTYTDEKSGIQLIMKKQADINTDKIKYRINMRFGVAALNPEMMGIMLFGQA